MHERSRIPAALDGEPVVELLREIRDAIVALQRTLELRRPAPATLSRADRARLARVLPALAGVFGSDDFTAADLFTDDAPAAARIVVRGLNARRVGRLFQRAEGVAVEGFVVARHGVELGAVLWQVLASPGNEKVSVLPRPAPGAL